MPRVLDIRGRLSILMLSISGGPASATGRSRARERDAATPRRPVRARERERQADIYGRGVREALKLRLLATALAVFTMMCSHTRSPPSIWEFPPFLSPQIAPLPSCRGTKNTDGCSADERETRRGPRMSAGEKRYFEIIGDCRLSGIVPIVSIPDIERVFNFTSRRLAMIFTRFRDITRLRILVEFRS